MVEFVSANPTGPLTVGHGRNAVLGDSVASLLTAVGWNVTREYYFNDAGRQMRVLGASLKARYLEKLGLPNEFPEDGYQGGYMYDIAQTMIDEAGKGFKDADLDIFRRRAQDAIFDSYYNEHSLYENGLTEDVVAELRAKGLVYEQDGATWFKTTAFGQAQDRVIIKNTGEPTYRLPDIAYHREKFRRGFARMINVFGSDHIATVPDGISFQFLPAKTFRIAMHYLAPGSFFKFTQRIADTFEIVAIFFSNFHCGNGESRRRLGLKSYLFCYKAKTILNASFIFLISSGISSPLIFTNLNLWSIGRVCIQSAIDFFERPFSLLGKISTFVLMRFFFSLYSVIGTT